MYISVAGPDPAVDVNPNPHYIRKLWDIFALSAD
jgi:hypothetical protein